MKAGIELIAQERKEQIEKHGRTIKRDVSENIDNQLMIAAEILSEEYYEYHVSTIPPPPNRDRKIWIKMLSKPYKERLIIAGAFIAAEIDRLQNS